MKIVKFHNENSQGNKKKWLTDLRKNIVHHKFLNE